MIDPTQGKFRSILRILNVCYFWIVFVLATLLALIVIGGFLWSIITNTVSIGPFL
jgi:hypothetical protein